MSNKLSIFTHESLWLGYAPLPALLLLIALLWASGPLPPHASIRILRALPLVFGVVAASLAAIAIGRSFLARGAPELLLLGSGVLVWGFSGMVGLYVGHDDPNVMIAVHNLGLFLSALLYLVGALTAWRPLQLGWNPLAMLISAYGAAAGMVGMITFSVLEQWTVPFFVQGQGGTRVRQIVLSSSMVILTFTAALILKANRGSAFSRWYSGFLLLIVVGNLAYLGQHDISSWLNSVGRLTYLLGGIYLLRAAWSVVVATGAAPLTLELPKRVGWPGYVMAICLVLASIGVRSTFQGFLGKDYPFITFFPSLMMAALFGGRGAGLLATLLSALLALFVVNGARLDGIPTSAYVPTALFLVTGTMIAFTTELMHRALARATEAEARAQAAAELTLAQMELRRTVAELTRSNEELERFAYVASHDLQEPLRMVHVFLGRLGDRCQGQLDVTSEQYLAFAMEGAEHMRELIHDLLAYCRVGFQPGTALPASAEIALDQALANLEDRLEQSGARVTRDRLPMVLGDSVQLTQLFQNLLANALKFRTECVPEIHVGFHRAGAETVFSVADNGIGINPQNAQRIFEIFQRLKAGKDYAGTGIGLAICKKIVERHGGRIWVEGQPGAGSTFFFTIPESSRRPA